MPSGLFFDSVFARRVFAASRFELFTGAVITATLVGIVWRTLIVRLNNCEENIQVIVRHVRTLIDACRRAEGRDADQAEKNLAAELANIDQGEVANEARLCIAAEAHRMVTLLEEQEARKREKHDRRKKQLKGERTRLGRLGRTRLRGPDDMHSGMGWVTGFHRTVSGQSPPTLHPDIDYLSSESQRLRRGFEVRDENERNSTSPPIREYFPPPARNGWYEDFANYSDSEKSDSEEDLYETACSSPKVEAVSLAESVDNEQNMMDERSGQRLSSSSQSSVDSETLYSRAYQNSQVAERPLDVTKDVLEHSHSHPMTAKPVHVDCYDRQKDTETCVVDDHGVANLHYYDQATNHAADTASWNP